MAAGSQRGAAALALVVVVLMAARPAQAQGVDTGLLRSLDACQKVVRKHLLMADATIERSARQLGDINSTLEWYVRSWGARAVAGQPTPTEQDAAGRRVRACRLEFQQRAANVSAALEDKLRQTVAGHEQWYDEKIFSLLTDVMSEESQDGLVQQVKDYLEPTLKQLDNQVVTVLRESIRAIKPAYRVVSTCIRELALRGD